MKDSKNAKEKTLYRFKGCVVRFGRIVDNNFFAETMATSPHQAKSQIQFQAKTKMGLTPQAPLSLEGKLTAVQ